MSSITPFPPQPESLAKAEAYVADKRLEIAQEQARNHAWRSSMLDAISGTLEDMGVNALVMGKTHLSLSDPAPHKRTIEAPWETFLSAKEFVGVIQTGNILKSYAGNEHADMNTQPLDVLIDRALVQQLAPSAVIYGPGDITPWPDLIGHPGLSIWVPDRVQFDALWAGIKDWMKTDWHDAIMATLPFKWTAAKVFDCIAITDLAPDLTFRQAQLARAQKASEQSAELGAWDAVSQCEIKKMVNSLIRLEGHPLFGTQAAAMLQQLPPILALSMEGKGRSKRLSVAEFKARHHYHAGLTRVCVDWNNWTPASPFPDPAPAAKPPKRKR